MSVTVDASNESQPSGRNRSRTNKPYDLVFFLAYAANALLMMAVSLLFRYSDFVEVSGGAELQLGLIVGIGAVGAILVRVLQGIGIDHFGAKHIWVASLVCYTTACFLHMTIGTVYSPTVYFVRILMQSGLAGTFGESLTFISLRVAPHRITEVLSMHGTSGFIGMALGPFLGDLLFSTEVTTRGQVNRMFLTAGCFGLVALICALLATRGRVHRVPSRRAPVCAVIKRYHPGMLLLIAAIMGVGLGLPGVYVRPFAESLDIQQIRWFFLAYNIVAFSVRVMTRRLPALIGERRMIALGISALVLSMPTYLLVRDAWQMILPAVVTGLGHAFLFPAVVALGGFYFPPRYRGLATTLTLGMFDLGNLIGQPLIGGLITVSRNNGLPAYPIMFLTVGLFIALSGATFFAFVPRQQRNRR